ncbi:hypothetical protein MUK42_34642 [Musa troglodytarum]|uniref:Uncharacterized protein n=1 Tax=Musa troglodytarum TaxID=320322 RepID=A0A9E7GGA8_9LILI|nr:hypothetical protein MUK42_34642 [Musa troglodytarum]
MAGNQLEDVEVSVELLLDRVLRIGMSQFLEWLTGFCIKIPPRESKLIRLSDRIWQINQPPHSFELSILYDEIQNSAILQPRISNGTTAMTAAKKNGISCLCEQPDIVSQKNSSRQRERGFVEHLGGGMHMNGNPDSSHMAHGDPLLEKLMAVALLRRASFFSSSSTTGCMCRSGTEVDRHLHSFTEIG